MIYLDYMLVDCLCKCGQIDHIFICLGRQSLISYRLAPFEFKVLGFFSQRLKGAHKKGVPQPLVLRESIWNRLRPSMHSSFMPQLGHQKNFFLRSSHSISGLCIPSFWRPFQHMKATINFPHLFPCHGVFTCVVCVCVCIYLLKLCVDLFCSPRQRELPLFYF